MFVAKNCLNKIVYWLFFSLLTICFSTSIIAFCLLILRKSNHSLIPILTLVIGQAFGLLMAIIHAWTFKRKNNLFFIIWFLVPIFSCFFALVPLIVLIYSYDADFNQKKIVWEIKFKKTTKNLLMILFWINVVNLIVSYLIMRLVLDSPFIVFWWILSLFYFVASFVWHVIYLMAYRSVSKIKWSTFVCDLLTYKIYC